VLIGSSCLDETIVNGALNRVCGPIDAIRVAATKGARVGTEPFTVAVVGKVLFPLPQAKNVQQAYLDAVRSSLAKELNDRWVTDDAGHVRDA